MKTLVAFPPMYHAIANAFNLCGRPAIFSWGEYIYNPYRLTITPELYAHEAVHGERQKDPERWWMEYIQHVDFRLSEEILAHRAEYAEFCKNHASMKLREKALRQMATRLGGSLYGNIIKPSEAVSRIAA